MYVMAVEMHDIPPTQHANHHQVMKGYLNKKDTELTFDEEGFLKTGSDDVCISALPY